MTGLLSAVITQVSEGIDFADSRARCVMVVGIPYPHAKDSKVNLKKEYNNATAAASARATAAAARQGQYGSSSSSRGGPPPRLLTGDAWYSQQAFRALNQVRGGDLCPCLSCSQCGFTFVVQSWSVMPLFTCSTFIWCGLYCFPDVALPLLHKCSSPSLQAYNTTRFWLPSSLHMHRFVIILFVLCCVMPCLVSQAIGRCIRHRLDYGAILLVDERFKEPRNQTSLSKWVRGTIRPTPTTQVGPSTQATGTCTGTRTRT